MVASTQKKKIGIYSGSFNPIHIGHLALANWLCEYTDMDEIWFLVTPQNPFKKNMDLMEDNMRLELVRRAVEDYPKFKVSDFEFSLPKPSYTIHTLRALSKNYPDYDFSDVAEDKIVYVVLTCEGSDLFWHFTRGSQALLGIYGFGN